jgi:hypothetical protein
MGGRAGCFGASQALLHDKRVERGAADGEREEKGDSLFIDHTHGSNSLFCCGLGARPIGGGERDDWPGLRII